MSQILRRYLTKEGRVRKYFYCLIWIKNPAFENLKGSHVRKFLGFHKLRLPSMLPEFIRRAIYDAAVQHGIETWMECRNQLILITVSF